VSSALALSTIAAIDDPPGFVASTAVIAKSKTATTALAELIVNGTESGAPVSGVFVGPYSQLVQASPPYTVTGAWMKTLSLKPSVHA
jgi:hypothetical protein